MKTAFLFPGQGAQTVGMGADVAQAFPAAAELFEKANEIVGFDLRKVCFEGPAERLNTTTMSQPAIFVDLRRPAGGAADESGDGGSQAGRHGGTEHGRIYRPLCGRSHQLRRWLAAGQETRRGDAGRGRCDPGHDGQHPRPGRRQGPATVRRGLRRGAARPGQLQLSRPDRGQRHASGPANGPNAWRRSTER